MLDRRQFLQGAGCGLGLLALRQSAGSREAAAKVSRVVQFTLIGGLSHVDSFDYKPLLNKRHGKSISSPTEAFFGKVGLLKRPDWEFRPRGASGLMISDLFPEISKQADDLTLLRGMKGTSGDHAAALRSLHARQNGDSPSLGSRLVSAWGKPGDEWPLFVVFPDGRGASAEAASVRAGGRLGPTTDGIPFDWNDESGTFRDHFGKLSSEEAEVRTIRARLDALHHEQHPDPIHAARKRTYHLADFLRVQLPQLADFSKEPKEIRDDYGIDRPETAPFARRCLAARRLLEKGVRFVQIDSGGPLAGSPPKSWDAHDDVRSNHQAEALRIDRPIAAFLRDLKRVGLFQETIVLFVTEFGRTPYSQSGAESVGKGRDHNPAGFSCWLAGGALRGGTVHGATDELGLSASEGIVTWDDLHATAAHLLGLATTQEDRRGKVITKILK